MALFIQKVICLRYESSTYSFICKRNTSNTYKHSKENNIFVGFKIKWLGQLLTIQLWQENYTFLYTVKSRAVARLGQQHVSVSSTPQKVKSLNSSTSWLVATTISYPIQQIRYNSKVIYFSYQNVGSSRILIRFFSIFIYPRGFPRIMIRYGIIKNAISKDFKRFHSIM